MRGFTLLVHVGHFCTSTEACTFNQAMIVWFGHCVTTNEFFITNNFVNLIHFHKLIIDHSLHSLKGKQIHLNEEMK